MVKKIIRFLRHTTTRMNKNNTKHLIGILRIYLKMINNYKIYERFQHRTDQKKFMNITESLQGDEEFTGHPRTLTRAEKLVAGEAVGGLADGRGVGDYICPTSSTTHVNMSSTWPLTLACRSLKTPPRPFTSMFAGGARPGGQ